MEVSESRYLVTGAASGIGRATAKRLLDDGGTVIAVDRDAEGLSALAGDHVETLAVDLSTPEGRAEVTAVEGVTHMVNAAGIIQLRPLDDVTEDEWDEIFAINARALFFLVQQIGPQLPRGGAIVNISSGAGKEGTTVEAALYSATKAVVMSVTRTFARAWADRGVRVNAVCPGLVATPMDDQVNDGIAAIRGITRAEVEAIRLAAVPMGYVAPPEEVASVIAFLLSEDARYMTGQSINISGGRMTY